MTKIIDPREKGLSPERLRKIRRIEKLVKKIKESGAFDDVPYAGRD